MVAETDRDNPGNYKTAGRVILHPSAGVAFRIIELNFDKKKEKGARASKKNDAKRR